MRRRDEWRLTWFNFSVPMTRLLHALAPMCHRAVVTGLTLFLAGPLAGRAGLTAADVAAARQAIFSPEAGVVISPADFPLLDTNHDGVVSLEDLNGLGDSPSRWKTLFVAPGRPAGDDPSRPVGSLKNPFVLTEGTETEFYQQVRKITFGSGRESGTNAEIVFLPGTYTRIQLALLNADANEVRGKPDAAAGSGAGAVAAVIDRFHPVRLLLRSLDPLAHDPARRARFFGGSAGTDPAGILREGPALRLHAQGIDGASPQFLEIRGVNEAVHPAKISDITVSGLDISCYRDGIDLLYARDIVLKNNRLKTIGSSRTPQDALEARNKTGWSYGTSAIGMARLCEDILIKSNRIDTTWNRHNPPDGKSGDELGLMHPFYIIESGDVAYLDNVIENSSGPLLKFVNLPDYAPDGTVTGNPLAGQRQVFIGNRFTQSTDRLDGLYPSDSHVMAMIHDNSAQIRLLPDKKIHTQPSGPAANMIFLGNTWTTSIDLDFLRRESVTTSQDGKSEIVSRFPNWLFEGNCWIGFHGPPRIVERERGTPISAKRDITGEVESDPRETVRLQSAPPTHAGGGLRAPPARPGAGDGGPSGDAMPRKIRRPIGASCKSWRRARFPECRPIRDRAALF